jgi:hypothetical protein
MVAVTLTEQPANRELDAAASEGVVFQLLQNGREDGNRQREYKRGGRILRLSSIEADSPPVHQLGVSRLGRSDDDLQTRRHSLERR